LQLAPFAADSATALALHVARPSAIRPSIRTHAAALDSSDLLLVTRGRLPRDRAFESVDAPEKVDRVAGESRTFADGLTPFDAGSLVRSLHRL
jgi:hypothetical protein